MGKFYNAPACVSGAAGHNVNSDTECMYRHDGLKLKVIRFEYYKSDDADYNWFILTSIDGPDAIRADRYKACGLYIERPSNAYAQNAIDDLYKLNGKLYKLDLQGTIRKLENPDAE